MQTLLLDTNVLIDYLGRKPPFFEDAERIIAAGYFKDAKLWAPVQSLNDVFYVLSKYLSSIQVQRAILAVCEIVTPIDLSASDAARALSMGWEDYEDCLVAVLAEKVKADRIITRDIKGFSRSLVPAMTPEMWLADAAALGITYDTVAL